MSVLQSKGGAEGRGAGWKTERELWMKKEKQNGDGGGCRKDRKFVQEQPG